MTANRGVLAVAFAVALLPGAWLAGDALRAAIGSYSHIPFWDHWATVADFVRAKTQGLSWKILFAQSNEHRILFPRIIMFADLQWFRGRNWLPYAGIVASQLALLALFAVIAWRQANRAAALLTLGVAGALIFSLAQWENLIWAFQVQFVMVATCGAWSIYLFCQAFAERDRIGWLAWAGSLVMLVISAFSMANGMIAGAAAIGVGLLGRFRWQGLVGQAVALALIAALYFHGYVSYGDHGTLAEALAQPAAFLKFVATYVGNPARAWGEGPPVLLGALGLALAAAAAARIVLRRDRDAGRIALAGLMAFVIGSAVVTAVGRLGFGTAQGLVSRYLTFGLMFWAAQVVYWGSLVPWRRPLWLLALAAVMAGLTFPISILQARSKPDLASRNEQIRVGVRALLSGSDDPGALGGLNWNVPAMMQQVAFLQQHRLSIFTTGPAHRLGEVFDPAPVVPHGCLGSFDGILPSGNGWRASGWAWDVQGKRAVEEVMVIDEQSRIVAIGEGGGLRPDVNDSVPEVRTDNPGWQASVGQGPPAGTPVVAVGVLKKGGTCDLGHVRWP